MMLSSEQVEVVFESVNKLKNPFRFDRDFVDQIIFVIFPLQLLLFVTLVGTIDSPFKSNDLPVDLLFSQFDKLHCAAHDQNKDGKAHQNCNESLPVVIKNPWGVSKLDLKIFCNMLMQIRNIQMDPFSSSLSCKGLVYVDVHVCAFIEIKSIICEYSPV